MWQKVEMSKWKIQNYEKNIKYDRKPKSEIRLINMRWYIIVRVVELNIK